VTHRRPLFAHQENVLRWISDGCPIGVMDGCSYKTTAVALQNRHLVTISKKGGAWSATITDLGRYYLDHGDYPPEELGNRTHQAESFRQTANGVSAFRVERAQSAIRLRPPELLTKDPPPTEKLITDLLEGGGEIRVSRADREEYQARVSAAIRHRKVPDGKQLVTEYIGTSGVFVIRLEDAPAWVKGLADAVPVPTTLRRPHPAVVALQAGAGLEDIGRTLRHRALLIIQALATGAERRGYEARPIGVTRDSYGYERRESRGHLNVGIKTFNVGIRLRQETRKVAHPPTAQEQSRAASTAWYSIPKWDHVPTDHLSLHLDGGLPQGQSTWRDSTRGLVESRLAEVLWEIELRACAAERARVAQAVAAEERKRNWERAMERARAAYAEAYRATALKAEVDAWIRSNQVRQYVSAMQSRIGTIDDADERVAAKEWCEWAEGWAEAHDPLRRPMGMPEVPEPRGEDLRLFLGGLNPFGPNA
jgi:hypothetical protein